MDKEKKKCWPCSCWRQEGYSESDNSMSESEVSL